MTQMLWLVRWEDGTCAIIAAADELELASLLDQQGDPNAAKWKPYKGPLWVEFAPKRSEEPVDFQHPKLVIASAQEDKALGVEPAHAASWLDVTIPGTDEAVDMVQCVLGTYFHLKCIESEGFQLDRLDGGLGIQNYETSMEMEGDTGLEMLGYPWRSVESLTRDGAIERSVELIGGLSVSDRA